MRLLLRLLVALFSLVTALYAFLASSSFTYQQFLLPRVLHWVAWFSDWHALLYWLWLALAVASLWPVLRQADAARRWAVAFAVTWTIVGLLMTAHPVLPALRDDHRSVVVGLVALLPLLWLSAIDHIRQRNFLRGQARAGPEGASSTEGRLLIASVGSTVFLSVTYGMLTPLALQGAFEPDLLTSGLTLGMAWSVYEHLLIFCGLFLLLALVDRVVAAAGFWWRHTACAAVLTVVLWLALQGLVGRAIGLDGSWGAVAMLGLSLAVIGTWAAIRLQRWASVDARLASGFDVFFGPGQNRHLSPATVASLLGVVALAYLLVAVAAQLDWDFLVLKLGVLLVWIVTFSQLYRASSGRTILGNGAVLAACVVPLAGHLVDPSLQSTLTRVSGPGSSVRHTLDRYVIYNPTFRLAEDVVHDRKVEAPAFDRFLRANTGLSAAAVSPAPIDFVADMGPSTREPRPLIFLLVIDSLRADYLSPYNARVTFTPRVAEFARESLVFRNAFTRYGGTGLSMSAMWMGAASPHRQYVQPFRSMNALEKLLDANGYRRYVSMDHIMEQLLTPVPGLVPLDAGIPELEYDFCRTLEEIDTKIRDGQASQPFFAHTRSLNLHVASLNRAAVPSGESYPGFEQRYAARVRRMDECFGRFIDVLKQRGLYERSVVILTGDHGEMLGEDRQWGHAYYLFPPVLEIPLLIHVPPAVAQRANVDLDAVCFSTDITPTLYTALGYEPHGDTLMGTSLLGGTGVDSGARRRSTEVVTASYGAVWGTLRQNGRHLYIVDANHGKEYAYDRAARGAWHAVEVADGDRAEDRRAIREHIYEINRIYRVHAE